MKYGKKSDLPYFKSIHFFAVLISSLVLVLFISNFGIIKTLAQTKTGSNYNVTVSPVFFDLIANPGSRVSDKIRVRNNTTQPLKINIQVKKLTGDEQGNLTLKDEDPQNTLSWVKFQSAAITARPLEWTEIPFTIDIPSSAGYGYYFGISLTQAEGQKNTVTGAKIAGAAAIPVLLNVKRDGAKAQAKLVDFSVGSYIHEYPPVDFKVKIENTGNIHVRPVGNIFISDGRNDNLAILDVNPGFGNIIPDTKREFDTSWADGFIVYETVMDEDGTVQVDKNGKPIKKLNIYWNKLTDIRIGKYTANLLMVYDNGTRDVPIEASKTFWIIPYKIIIGFIMAVLILIFGTRFMLRRYIQKEVRKRTQR